MLSNLDWKLPHHDASDNQPARNASGQAVESVGWSGYITGLLGRSVCQLVSCGKKVGRKFSAIIFCNSSVANAHALTRPNKNLPTWPRRFEVVTEMVMVSI